MLLIAQGLKTPLLLFQGYSDTAGFVISAGDLLARLQALTTPEKALYLLAPGPGGVPQTVTGYQTDYTLFGLEPSLLVRTSGGLQPSQVSSYTAAQLIAALSALSAGVLEQPPVVLVGTGLPQPVTRIKLLGAFGDDGPPAADAYIALCTNVVPPRWPAGTGGLS